MNKQDFVPYDQALALKELGFNEPCMGYFDTRLEHQIGNFNFTEIEGYNSLSISEENGGPHACAHTGLLKRSVQIGIRGDFH